LETLPEAIAYAAREALEKRADGAGFSVEWPVNACVYLFRVRGALLYEDCVGVLVSNADDITVAYYGEQSQTSFQLDALDWLDLQWVAYPSCPGLWVPLNKCIPDIYMKELEEGGHT